MSTESEPSEPYPSQWRPKEAPPFEPEIEPTAVELWLASLDEDEYKALERRVRSRR